MWTFNSAAGTTTALGLGIWLIVFAALFIFNEFARRWKWAGFLVL